MNTSEIPSGGWQFHQPHTGWSAPSPIGYTFDQQVGNIIKHRQANPAIVMKHKLSLDPSMVGQELIDFQIARGAIKAPPKPIPSSALPQLPGVQPGAVLSAVAAVKKLASGAASLLEWEDAGMPHVEPEVAYTRSATCAKCPKNRPGKSLTDYFTTHVADLFNKRFQKLQEKSLTTPSDSVLNVCEACLCPLKTKIWMPAELILKRLKPEYREELNQEHPRCWILDLA